MPISRSAAGELADRVHCAQRLRDQSLAITERALEPLRQVAEPYRSMSEDLLRMILYAYLEALAEAVASESTVPFDDFIAGIRDYWGPSGLKVGDIIRGLRIVSETCRDVVCLSDGEERLLDRWAQEATARIAERAVAAVTGELASELDRHRQGEERLLALQRVSAAVLSELDLTSVLEMIADEAMQLMEARAAAIRLLNQDTGKLQMIASAGQVERLMHADAMPLQGSLSGYAFRSRKPVISSDLKNDPRLSDQIRESTVLRSLLGVPLIVRDEPIGVLIVSDREHGPFTLEDQRLLSLFADQAAAAIEHAQLYEHAQGRIAELAALQRISSVISSSLDIDEVFRAIYDEIRGVMAADAFLISLARSNGRFDVDFIMDGGQRFPPRHDFEISPAMRRAVEERQAIILDDIRSPDSPPMHTVGHPEGRVRSIVAAPLLNGNEVVGMLSAQSYQPHHYRQSDADLLMTIAHQAAVAIAHARLYRQAQSLAVAEERNRLAREIHDTLAQGLIGIILYLERLDLMLEGGDVKVRDLVDRARALAQSNLEEARRSVKDLRAAPLEGRTLVEALAHLVEELRAEGSFALELTTVDALPMLRARVETALFRVAQEATSNCRKHAQCANVSIALRIVDDDLVLEVSDNGRGFDPVAARARANRFGLSSMRERLQQIGGDLEVESRPGDGTTVRACVPLSAAIYSELGHEA